MIGTVINVIAIIIGGIIGLLIHKKLPKKIIHTTFQAIGLFTIVLGISMAIQTTQFFAMILSLVIGSICGSILHLDRVITRFAEFLKNKIKSTNTRFSEGFITSFLLFCMGSLTILGSIEDGLGGPPTLLFSKSVLDGFSSIALAATMGAGVIFSALPLLVYQGSITLITSFFEQSLSLMMISELSAVGGVLLIGLGIDILELKKVVVINMLPSLFVMLFIVSLLQ